MSNDLISIREALDKGIERIRMPKWAMKEDHLYVKGVWGRLYSPFNKECNGRDGIERLLLEEDLDSKLYVEYSGPLPESDEYKAAEKQFEGCLGEKK